MKTEIRTVSQNGQVAIPKYFLKALGLTPPVKVRLTQEREAVVIRKSPMTRMSDEAFSAFLDRLRLRTTRVTPRQVAASIRHARRLR
jgi:bifunctional DNA-binding transcriptional regulator/antitoxin component of YhaV-PrlF toxin-antitoxin module